MSPANVTTKQQRIAELANHFRDRPLTALSHHIDLEWMHEAYRRTRKDGAAGVDKQTAQEYAANLEENLQSLLNRAKSGESYRAPPVRRVHIPKGEGDKTRPIGIPTFEDKVLQRAVVMALEPVYEQMFFECSYGFRPKRGAHDALNALWKQMMQMHGGWVLEADIEDFFGSVDHTQLREMIDQRMRDGVLKRLLGKWLKAGVMEDGCVYHPESGTPQGGVVSPLLANIYLHEVLDVWFHEQALPRLRGRAFMVRYADDFVMVFETEGDARKVKAALENRLGRYGLRLHPDKTRLIPFRRPSQSNKEQPPKGTTFDLLGFTHYWGLSRKSNWVLMRKTMKSRLSRAVRTIAQWCRENRHLALRDQQKKLTEKLRGHDAYYGITNNMTALERLRRMTVRVWHKWLSRRSHAGRHNWKWMNEVVLSRYPLPPARIVHSAVK